MRLGALIDGLGLTPVAGADPELRICDITEDSRTVLPGSLFIARPGTRDDGRRHIAQAVAAGAVAVIIQEPATAPPGRPGALAADIAGAAVLAAPDAALAGARIAERFYADPSARLTLAGITGTNGKSTIAHLVHRARNALGQRTGLVGTVEIDDGAGLAPAEMTTPPATEISRTLAMMLEHGCSAATMEVSSHALDQQRVAALAFRVAVFTNLTRDHLNYHGTMEAYAAAKARLFDALPPDGLAIVNAQDPAWPSLTARCRARILHCAHKGSASVPHGTPPEPGLVAEVRIHHASLDGMDLSLAGPWGEARLRSPLVGRHNAMNLLQSGAVLWALGHHAGEWGPALARVGPPAGRLERVCRLAEGSVAGPAVLVDYAHTPDAIESVVGALRAVAPGRPITLVFGAGGDKDQGKRPMMGRIGAMLADRIILTSDNPRSEPPSVIIDQILAGVPGDRRDRVVVHADRARAIDAAIAGADPSAIVLIAGKGHETTQVAADERGVLVSRPFDDRQVAREALHRRAAAHTPA